jgi:hypothetical protein
VALNALVVTLLATIDTAAAAVAELVFGGFALVVQVGIVQSLFHSLIAVDGMAKALVLSACLGT